MSEPARDVILRRIFRNDKGDWKKLEKQIKEINTYAEVVQGLADDLVKAETRLKALMLEAYQLAPKVDCLFYDSPISPDKQTFFLRSYLKKLNWSGVRDIMVDPNRIKPFADNVKEGCKWLLKFQTGND
jgi:hypothetical protein